MSIHQMFPPLPPRRGGHFKLSVIGSAALFSGGMFVEMALIGAFYSNVSHVVIGSLAAGGWLAVAWADARRPYRPGTYRRGSCGAMWRPDAASCAIDLDELAARRGHVLRIGGGRPL